MLGADDADHGDAGGQAILVWLGAVRRRKEVLHNRLAHRLGHALAGAQVHQQPRATIDFQNRTALAGQGLLNVLADQIDPGNVQPHHLGRQSGQVRRIGMHLGRAIDGGHGRTGVGAALRVFPARGRHQLAAHHQQAVYGARNMALDHHMPGHGAGRCVGAAHLRLGGQVDAHAFALVRVVGLDGDGQANVLRLVPGLVGAADQFPLGHRYAGRFEQLLGQVFVFADAQANGAGLVGFCTPDAPLRRAVAQLHQIAIVQADKGNAPLRRRIDDAGRAWPQVTRLDGLLNGGHGGGHIKRLVIDRRHDEGVALLQRHFGHQFFGAAKHHAVHPALAHAAGLAKLSAHAGQVEQLDDGVLQHMAAPRAFLQAL